MASRIFSLQVPAAMHLFLWLSISSFFLGEGAMETVGLISSTNNLDSDFDPDYRDFNTTVDIMAETSGNRERVSPTGNMNGSDSKTRDPGNRFMKDPTFVQDTSDSEHYWIFVAELAALVIGLQLFVFLLMYCLIRYIRNHFFREIGQEEERNTFQFSRLFAG